MRGSLIGLALLIAGCGSEPAPSHLALTEAQARPLTDRTFESTPARVERGQGLVEGTLRCFTCHSPRDWDQSGAPPVEGMEGAGAVHHEAEGVRLVAPNLTPDRETGIGTWTDDMLARAIREGVGHDGRVLSSRMEYRAYSTLSDEDLASVIVFLRSRQPVHNPLPPTVLPMEMQHELAARLIPITEPVSPRDLSDPIERGRYLTLVADCEGCHTAWEAPRNPGLLGGGNVIDLSERETFSTNISPHATGAFYDADVFVTVMRTGKGGTLSGLMPWTAFATMSDEDLRAIHAFLLTMQPVAHAISNQAEPTWCPVCEQTHGLGETNTVERPVGVPVERTLLDEYVGAYSAFGFTIHVTREGDQLRAQEDEGPVADLVPQSDTRFLMVGGAAPLRFVRDEAGAVTAVVSEEVEPFVLSRVAERP